MKASDWPKNITFTLVKLRRRLLIGWTSHVFKMAAPITEINLKGCERNICKWIFFSHKASRIEKNEIEFIYQLSFRNENVQFIIYFGLRNFPALFGGEHPIIFSLPWRSKTNMAPASNGNATTFHFIFASFASVQTGWDLIMWKEDSATSYCSLGDGFWVSLCLK